MDLLCELVEIQVNLDKLNWLIKWLLTIKLSSDLPDKKYNWLDISRNTRLQVTNIVFIENIVFLWSEFPTLNFLSLVVFQF